LTKIISAENIDFGKVEEFQPKTMSGKITNIGTERVTISGLVSDNPKFIANITEKLMEPKFPASSNIYFLNAKKTIQSASGVISTTNLGFGKAGITDADGKFTFKPVMLALTLTAPTAGTKYKLSESFNVTWTSSDITLINVILESESGGYKKYSDVDATLGTLAVAISASDGFSINETVYIYIENTHQTVEDNLQVATVATLTTTTPVLTAGTEGAITGTHNGGTGYFVQVQYRVASPEGAWTTFENNVAVEADGTWEATGTVALAETYDFRARDTVDPDGQIQLDDVEVASGVVSTALQITNASDAAIKGDIFCGTNFILGDNIIVSGMTNSTKIDINGTGYLTGVGSGTAYKKFVLSVGKNHTVNWIKFYELQIGLAGSKSLCVNGGYIYTTDLPYVGGKYVSTLKKIDPSDGSSSSLTLSQEGGVALAYACDTDGTYIYCFGGIGDLSKGTIWKVTVADFATQTASKITGTGWFSSGFIDGSIAYCGSPYFNSTDRVDMSSMTLHSSYFLLSTHAGQMDVSSTMILATANTSANGNYFRMGLKSDMSIQSYTERYTALTNSIHLGCIKFNGTDFIAFFNDGSKFIIRKIADSNSYSAVGSDIDVTPNSVVALSSSFSGFDYDLTHYCISASLKGDMESGFGSDTTYYNGFIKLIEK
jgi:hypothetical protein